MRKNILLNNGVIIQGPTFNLPKNAWPPMCEDDPTWYAPEEETKYGK